MTTSIKYVKGLKAAIIDEIKTDVAAMNKQLEELGYPTRIRNRHTIRAIYHKRDPAKCWIMIGNMLAIQRELSQDDCVEPRYSVDYLTYRLADPLISPSLAVIEAASKKYGEYEQLETVVAGSLSFVVDYSVGIEEIDFKTVVGNALANVSYFDVLLSGLINFGIIAEKMIAPEVQTSVASFLDTYTTGYHIVRILTTKTSRTPIQKVGS